MQVAHDQRDTPRRSVLKSGRIVFNGGRSTIECTIRNISARGAKLQVSSVVGIPDSFDLVVSASQKQGCRVQWRRLKELGVRFTSDS